MLGCRPLLSHPFPHADSQEALTDELEVFRMRSPSPNLSGQLGVARAVCFAETRRNDGGACMASKKGWQICNARSNVYVLILSADDALSSFWRRRRAVLATRAGGGLVTHLVCSAFLLACAAASAEEEVVPVPSFRVGDMWKYSFTVDGTKQFDYTETVSLLGSPSVELLTSTSLGKWTLATYDAERHRYLVRYDLLGGDPAQRGPVLTDESKNDAPVKFPFKVGESWPVALTYPPFTMGLQGRVTGREVIAAPAGQFDTYKVELTGLYRDHSAIGLANVGRYSETYWYSPVVKRHVRKEVRYWGISYLKTTSAPMYYRVQELLDFHLADK